MRKVLRPGLALIRGHLRAYVVINLIFFSLVAAGTAYSFARPELQRELTRDIVQGFDAAPLSYARDAYLSRNVAAAALVTFLVNSVFGSLLTVTLPTLLLPYAGLVVGLFRALLWGIALAPTNPELAAAMVPHSLTLLLEGEGYVLAMFGAYLLWARALAGSPAGLAGFAQGYRAGLRDNLALYVLVLLVLAVAAVYEAFEVIYLVGRG